MPCVCFSGHVGSLERSNGIFLHFYFSGKVLERVKWEPIPALFCGLDAYQRY